MYSKDREGQIGCRLRLRVLWAVSLVFLKFCKVLLNNKISKMQGIRIKFRIIVFFLLMSICVNKLSAQTPADDPGIGGAGVGSAPSGDGSPIVPFDGGMSLILLASGITFASKKVKLH